MKELSDRQVKILKIIIEEYMDSAEPVGSQKLEKKYELGVSPATIRNEMVLLTKAGYLRQPHASAGRVPTKDAFKLYLDRLMEEKKLSVTQEVAAKEKIWDARFDFSELVKQATRSLASQSRMLAVANLESGDVFHSGYVNLLNDPEFFDIDVTKTVLSILDEIQGLTKLFEKSFGEGPIHCLLGEEMGYEILEPCGMVFANFEAGQEKRGSLGVIGPCRLDYPKVVPMVKYYTQLVEELARSL